MRRASKLVYGVPMQSLGIVDGWLDGRTKKLFGSNYESCLRCKCMITLVLLLFGEIQEHY